MQHIQLTQNYGLLNFEVLISSRLFGFCAQNKSFTYYNDNALKLKSCESKLWYDHLPSL